MHSVESPSRVDPQWNILYWGCKWNLHTVCCDAVGCEWGTISVYFEMTYVCFIPSRLPVFAVCQTQQCLSHPSPTTPGPFGEEMAGEIFKIIFVKENIWILIKISQKFVPRSPIDNKSTLVQVMAWRRTGDKSEPEQMPTQLTDAYIRN